MRILGKGSVSSVIGRILDIFWYAFFAIFACVMIAAAVFAFVPVPIQPGDGTGFTIQAEFLRVTFDNLQPGDLRLFTSGTLAVAGLGICVAQLVIGRLRRIFKALKKGVVFNRENVVHIRAIGFICIGGAVVMMLAYLLFGVFVVNTVNIPGVDMGVSMGSSANGIFLGLVILVLSEVFAMAVKLQEDSDLTV